MKALLASLAAAALVPAAFAQTWTGERGHIVETPAKSWTPEEEMARPMIMAQKCMVTSLNPQSSMAGMRILLEGGNAFDAAVATAVAATVIDPKDSTIGGNGFATIYVAQEHRVRCLNFYGTAPAGATIDALKGKDYRSGYLSSPVPSNLKGYEVLQKTYGRLPWKDVLQPAIELAEKGFPVTDEWTGALSVLQARLNYPTSRRVFFPDGRLPRNGEIFRQPDLARTLRRIADEGADVFYKGEIAHRIDRFYRDHGGLITYDDLAHYTPAWVTPISTTYRGYTIFTQPPNSSGIALLLQMNLLEGFDLRALGHNSAQYLHLIGEVQRLAIADRNRYVADPEFVSVPIERLVSKAYANERRKLISTGRTMAFVPAPAGAKPDKEDTTHLTAVDEDGNMVSLTQTMGAWYGSGVIVADTGVLFSNQMRHLHTDPASPSRVGPGRRPRSNQSPLIILKDGQPYLAIGTPGNDGIWQRMAQVLANLFDFGMDIQHAVDAPRMIYGGFEETGTKMPPIFAVEDRIPRSTMAALAGMGYQVHPIPTDEGSVNGTLRDPATGFLYGGADARRLGLENEWSGVSYSVYAVGW